VNLGLHAEEDTHLDGRACFALGCSVASLVVFASPALGIIFSAMGLIFAGASLISVDEPASPRTRRLAFEAAALGVLALATGLLLLLNAP
jgi:hypothetical protein